MENIIYFGSLTGHLFTLDAQSGEEFWTTPLPDQNDPDPIFDSSPTIGKSHIVVGSIGCILYGANKDTGRLEWSFKLSDEYIFSSPFFWKYFIFIGSCDGTINKIKIPK